MDTELLAHLHNFSKLLDADPKLWFHSKLEFLRSSVARASRTDLYGEASNQPSEKQLGKSVNNSGKSSDKSQPGGSERHGTLFDDESDEEEAPPTLVCQYRKHNVYAAACLQSGDYTNAWSFADKALRENKDSVKALRIRAQSAFHLKKFKEAYADMCEAQTIDYDPEYVSLQTQMKAACETPTEPSAPSQSKSQMPNSKSQMPNFEDLINNPNVMQMANNLMQNPELVHTMMNALGATGQRRQ